MLGQVVYFMRRGSGTGWDTGVYENTRERGEELWIVVVAIGRWVI